MTSRRVQAVIYLATGVYLVGFLFLKIPAVNVIQRLVGFAGLVSYIAVLTFDRYLWKFALFRRFFPKPVLHGTWKGTFKSNYEQPETGRKLEPTETYFSMIQTYTTLHVRFLTSESMSDSVACEVRTLASGRHQVCAVYENTPRMELRDRSPIHRGGFILEVDGDPATALNGTYWTDRLTRGDLHFEQRSKQVYDSFEKAREGIYQ